MTLFLLTTNAIRVLSFLATVIPRSTYCFINLIREPLSTHIGISSLQSVVYPEKRTVAHLSGFMCCPKEDAASHNSRMSGWYISWYMGPLHTTSGHRQIFYADICARPKKIFTYIRNNSAPRTNQ